MINFLQVPPVEPQPGFMQQYSFIIMIGLMVLVLWLFMWRPESKRRKQMQAFREGLKKGDKVITAGGIYGTVVKADESPELVVEIAEGVNITVNRLTVRDVVNPQSAAPANSNKKSKVKSKSKK